MNYLNELKEQIEKASELYYNTGTSFLTDEQYDMLVTKASRLGYVEKVGAKPVSNIPTIVHDHDMLSLSKVHTGKEVIDFIGDKRVLFMSKADGLTCSATYSDGVLVKLETRGDGKVGNDILFHAMSIDNLPKYINKDGLYVIDGEVVILRSDFDKINEESKEKYANPRNLAAGSLNQLDPKVSSSRRLKFFAWDVIEGGVYGKLSDNLNEAIELGFTVVPNLLHYKSDTVVTSEDIDSYIDAIKEESDLIGLPIDGVVIKYDDVYLKDKLGNTEHHFRNATAYKFTDESYPTTLTGVTWQVGKSNAIIPVLEFEPVEISGSVVERCTAHNISIYKSLGITEGCTCYIKKANDIIPNCVGTDDNGGEPIPVIDVCPVCGAPTKIIKQNDSEMLYCTNENCKGALLGKLKHFVSKSGLDIEGLSEQTLKTLVNMGAVNSFEDIFKLKAWKVRLSSVPGFGTKSIDKLLKSIDEASQHVDLAHFISALSIAGIGLAQGKVLAQTFDTWAKFYECATNKYDFTSIDGIGSVLSKNIHKYFAQNKDVDMLTAYITFADDEPKKSEGDAKLNGLIFVVTGKVYTFKNRNELSDKIQSLGGHVASSVTAKTNFLINNDATSGSTKNRKAHELGVKIITEDEFLEMIR